LAVFRSSNILANYNFPLIAALAGNGMIESANYYKIALNLGLLKTTDVQSWVNDQILAGVEPADKFIEIAYLKESNLLDTIHMLSEIDDNTDNFQIVRCLLNKIKIDQLQDIEFCIKLSKCLYNFVVEHDFDVPEDLYDMMFFDEEYELAIDGVYGTLETWHKEFLEFISSIEKPANKAFKRN